MFKRLRAWAALWPELCENLFRVTRAPPGWRAQPWLFTPADLKPALDVGLAGIKDLPFKVKWSGFEDIVPWKRPQYSAKAALVRKMAAQGGDTSDGARGSTECFYIDEHGRKADAVLFPEELD